jgi:hypothetical protein
LYNTIGLPSDGLSSDPRRALCVDIGALVQMMTSSRRWEAVFPSHSAVTMFAPSSKKSTVRFDLDLQRLRK